MVDPRLVDVLILGFGPAGASAAIAAHDAGASVMVAEKMRFGGDNCLNSGGFLFAVDGPRAVDHLDALCFGKPPRDVLAAFAAGLGEVPDWLASLGGRTAPVDVTAFMGMLPSWPHFPGAGHVSYRQAVPLDGERPGPALFRTCVRPSSAVISTCSWGRPPTSCSSPTAGWRAQWSVASRFGRGRWS